MKLTLEQIQSITLGAIAVTEGPDGVEFHRFTPAQKEMYRNKEVAFSYRSQASSGIKLCFRTDSKSLDIMMWVQDVQARSFFCLEVFVDGERIGCIDNYSDRILPQDYSEISFPTGEFAKNFSLGDGEKTVTVYLPWNKRTTLQALSLDDGAYIKPVKYEKKLMAFGDSITQGFDALWPSRRYAGRLAEALGAEEINKAIGGETFCPDLSELRDDFTPDYILVAYGTNDWRKKSKADFHKNVEAFFNHLTANYPGVKTFVVTPIWRSNLDLETDFESFSEIEEGIRKAVEGKENVTVIRGFDLVPHSIEFFGDYGLHPNNEGFDHYFKNLWEQLKRCI